MINRLRKQTDLDTILDFLSVVFLAAWVGYSWYQMMSNRRRRERND